MVLCRKLPAELFGYYGDLHAAIELSNMVLWGERNRGLKLKARKEEKEDKLDTSKYRKKQAQIHHETLEQNLMAVIQSIRWSVFVDKILPYKILPY